MSDKKIFEDILHIVQENELNPPPPGIISWFAAGVEVPPGFRVARPMAGREY